ncbi:MAG: dihydrolipoamide acetyltransferase family protein [Acidimicrobiales bacterium]
MPDIEMPQLGETVVEGTIIKWFKKVGDRVDRDETLFEVSTDKVDSEVPSVASGYLAEILVGEGETVDVGTRLAVITDEQPAGGNGGQPAAGGGAGAPAAGAPEAEHGDESPRPARAEDEIATAAADPADVAGTSPPPPPPPTDTNGSPASAAPAGTRSSSSATPRSGGAALLSPVVRRLIAEHGLDAGDIPGTGQEGRVTRADVLSYLDRGAAGRQATAGPTPGAAGPRPAPAPTRPAPGAPAPAAPSATAPAGPVPGAGGAPRPAAPAVARQAPAAPARPATDDQVVPFSNIRRRTAEHMVRSQATSAHVLTVVEVDFAAVDRVRRAVREDFKAREGFSLTYLPFVSRAAVDALAEFPHVNASVGEDSLILHRRVHLGFAVDLDFEGLIVPVVRDADSKRLTAIARDLADLAARARSRQLTADDISGGTFTITNPGPFGTFLTAPVINQPQVAILSTDGVRKRPVAVELPDGSDVVAVHPVGNLALSFDHRAFDGAYASAFLGRVRQILETRDWSTEL